MNAAHTAAALVACTALAGMLACLAVLLVRRSQEPSPRSRTIRSAGLTFAVIAAIAFVAFALT